jgi:hypothetical protein
MFPEYEHLHTSPMSVLIKGSEIPAAVALVSIFPIGVSRNIDLPALSARHRHYHYGVIVCKRHIYVLLNLSLCFLRSHPLLYVSAIFSMFQQLRSAMFGT